eukprot:scaffold3670_cov124-Cylindrotheca_fusiformis.AAC.31
MDEDSKKPAMRFKVWTPPQVKDKKTPLPADFVPQPYSVRIGRGKVCSDATGNRRLQVLASSYLEDYNNASTKMEKSVIVSKIVDAIKEACPVGAFIRREDGKWWEVDDVSAREKVGTIIRDLLADKYRSSSKAKISRRQKHKQQNSSTTGTTSVAEKESSITGRTSVIEQDSATTSWTSVVDQDSSTTGRTSVVDSILELRSSDFRSGPQDHQEAMATLKMPPPQHQAFSEQGGNLARSQESQRPYDGNEMTPITLNARSSTDFRRPISTFQPSSSSSLGGEDSHDQEDSGEFLSNFRW